VLPTVRVSPPPEIPPACATQAILGVVDNVLQVAALLLPTVHQ
jgi:hypothetical protein